MAKFLLNYMIPEALLPQMGTSTPDEMEKTMELWQQWGAKAGDKLVDFGTPLANTHTITKSSSTDSPGARINVGYSFVEAENVDVVKVLLETHPHLQWNDKCEIDIHEIQPVPGM